MSNARLGRAQKAMALVPLALLSAAWTASLAGVGANTAAADPSIAAPLPDGTHVPTEAIKTPASVSAPDSVAPGLDTKLARDVSTVSASGIPSVALAAYQRAETVINAADKSCNLTWQLIAAIGRVESDHGRTGGNTLNASGVAEPGIFGPALNGAGGTTRIADTDAGQYDSDTRFDHAIGPMQFIPSTWSVVGVDADGDGKRDPQNINDAALATAVYLCSGNDDLSTTTGQRHAVYRYNHSSSYVDMVLSIMRAYLDGDYTSVPNSTTTTNNIVPTDTNPSPNSGGDKSGKKHHDGNTGTQGPGSNPTHSPSDNPSTGPHNGGGQSPSPGTGDGTGNGNAQAPTLPPAPTTSTGPIDQVLTAVQARAQCLLEGYLVLTPDYRQCVYDYTH